MRTGIWRFKNKDKMIDYKWMPMAGGVDCFLNKIEMEAYMEERKCINLLHELRQTIKISLVKLKA